ncbi:DUF1285 domain-containing protein [Aliiroseovarius sp. F20344]|uniref:DUF1285 domain-containing protein n=1 Tax=Aliiroseovarius sp. F20344 TaxID=2926414 RepID=UPI001FF5C6F9|nr:DUF1285 domain-containing protein [Aliiroseovarius sp. F20344]MCK0142877.1 DUF1285 domain-containing protein [Aliiroseovarius sp. F20344]
MTKAPSAGKSAKTRPSAPEALAKAVGTVSAKAPPPVHLWTPDYSGEIDIRIDRDGTWFHEGDPITRDGLVRLFSSILRKEEECFFLVTPVEKWGITVEDAPFVATDLDVEGEGRQQCLRFTTHVGDTVIAGPKHPIRLDHIDDMPSPYVEIRAGLEARIDRKSFYRLIDLGVAEDHDSASWFGVWSNGQFFPLIPTDELG